MTAVSNANMAQIKAAQPSSSTWVSANAGSGKTKVLIDRVTRLLLNQTLPQHILCLTYTKAAASHMQNKLFERLGAWSMLSDQHLLIELKTLGEEGQKLNLEKLIQARQLFARALDAPGGLKIQTIHSFCASILRRFPLEAGISPHFIELDERNIKLLQQEVLDDMAINDISGIFSEASFLLQTHETNSFLDEIAKYRDLFNKTYNKEEIYKCFEIKSDLNLKKIIETGFLKYDFSTIESSIEYLASGSSNDIKIADKLKLLNLKYIDINLLLKLSEVFLVNNDSEVPFRERSFPTVETIKRADGGLNKFIEFKSKFCLDLRNAKILYQNFLAANSTIIIHNFANAYLKKYSQLKSNKGYLDFDDQILLVKKLLSKSSMAQWVMYKLDGGIEHILIDEAQDTSPDQWDVIKLLTEEFNTIELKTDKPRTIFAVGDEKQSIYSFQGADPFAFEKMKQYFSKKLIEANEVLSEQNLLYSFRSAPTILELVDKTLKQDALSLNLINKHIAFKDNLPGRVDLWPFIESEKTAETSPWFQPIDSIKPNDPNIILAKKIANEIKTILAKKQVIESAGEVREIQPRDFLILLRSRKSLFHAIIKELKSSGLPVAGADRLNITAELAVKDLLSLLHFLLTPDDDLNLAALLKSPLCSISEQHLYHLAQNRKGSLWQSLIRASNEHQNILNFLIDMRNNLDFCRPFELLELALIKHQKRLDLTAKLGLEAEEGINALLDQALNFETQNIPDLTSFLIWMEGDDIFVKRELETESSNIRVMTIHGAKGLESPIVILPDTASKANKNHSRIVKLNDSIIAMRETKDNQSSILKSSIERSNILQRQEESRLLYVAMTRAESWLIICGAGKRSKNSDCWYDTIENGMKSFSKKTDSKSDELGLTIKSANWITSAHKNTKVIEPIKFEIPPWVEKPKRKTDQTLKKITPSQLTGSRHLIGSTRDNENNTKALGSQIHMLIECLPQFTPQSWEEIGHNILKNSGFENFESRKNAIKTSIKILTDDNLKFIFNSNSVAEVPFQIKIPEVSNTVFSGVIDRIINYEESVLAIDFKSNFLVPKLVSEVPDGILQQMAVYFRSLEILYPEKKVDIAILWTETSNLMFLDNATLRNSLQSVLNT